jgi:hypothetical protein
MYNLNRHSVSFELIECEAQARAAHVVGEERYLLTVPPAKIHVLRTLCRLLASRPRGTVSARRDMRRAPTRDRQ